MICAKIGRLVNTGDASHTGVRDPGFLANNPQPAFAPVHGAYTQDTPSGPARPACPGERGGNGAELHLPACRPRPGARRGWVSQSRTVNICISRSRLANGGRVRRRRAPWREAGAGRRRRRHVREHGRAQAPGYDQPVRADGRLRGRPGEAVAAGGPLAVRDGPQRLFPRDQHPLQPPSPPDDVHSRQHPRHAPKLPRRPHHVLPPQGLRELPQRRQRQPDGRHVAAAALPAHRHRQLRGTRLADRGLTPRGRTAPPAATAAPVDSGPPFPGVRLAATGPPTGRLRTQGPPRHGGREIREAPPPSRRPGPRGAGERTSLRAPFTLLCLHPFSPEPWRGETGPSSQPTGCLHACPAAQACGAPLPWIRFRVTWVLVDRSSENKQPSPEDSSALPRPAPALELPGASGPRSPPSGTQSLLRMCACSCVCVFICMSLFKKQPSLWGSWTLHVRVSPPSPAAPPPRALRLSPAPWAASLALPCREKDCGKLQDSSHPSPSACLLGLPACLPRARGYPIPSSFPSFNKGEERVPNHHQALWSCLVS